MIGSRVVAEATGRGHRVTGTSRSGAAGTEVLQAADAAAVAALAQGHDAVVQAVSPPRDGSPTVEPFLADGLGVLNGLRDAGVSRLVIVGGAGSLEAAPGVRLMDTPDFPDRYKDEALAQGALLERIRAEAGDLEWTYISPAALIEPGERTGSYRIGGDQLLVDAEGNSYISAEDYAIAVVDVLEKGGAVRERISVAH